jgi:hypothetical protein
MFCYSIPLKELRANIHFWEGFCGVIKDHWDRGNRFRGLIEIAESASNCGSRFRVLNETAESASAVSLKPPNPLPQSHWNHRIRFRGLIETAEADYFKGKSRISRQIRSHMRNGFSPWFRALEWIQGSKISWHCPFKHQQHLFTENFVKRLLKRKDFAIRMSISCITRYAVQQLKIHV